MATFKSYLYLNYDPDLGNLDACVCGGSENPPKTWSVNPLIHTYKFHSDNWGMRVDEIVITGGTGQILGQPIGFNGLVIATFQNRGLSFEQQYYIQQGAPFPFTWDLKFKEYFRIINEDTNLNLYFWANSYYYHVASGGYAGLKATINGNENTFWSEESPPTCDGGVYVSYRNDAKVWIMRLGFDINPDPPAPSYPLQYLDGPQGAGYHWGVTDGLWPGLIREWIED